MNKTCRGIMVLALVMGFGATEAWAAPVTFNTSGVFSVGGMSTVTFMDGTGMTTLTFNGAASTTVFTPAGASFGDIVVTSNEPSGALGPPIAGSFELDFNQTAPPGTGHLTGGLSGTLGFDMGVATLTFSTTSVLINGFTYTVNPVYTIALPVTGGGGGAGKGTTTLQGVIVGGTTVPDNGNTLVLLGAVLLGLVLVQRRLQSA